MAIDASIYSQIQKPEFESPINAMAKVAQYQNAQNQNALAQYKLNSAQREDEQNKATSLAFQNALNPDGTVNRSNLTKNLVSAGSGSKALEYQKAFADQDKTQAETDKNNFETKAKKLEIAGQAFGFVKNNPTPENAHMTLDYLEQNGVYPPELIASYKQKVNENPGAIQQLATQVFTSVMKAKDQLPTFNTRNTGGSTDTLSIDPITGKAIVVSSVKNTQSPDNIANNAVKVREQNMVDARQREQFNAPQYMETDQGLVALPKKLAVGQMPTATPVKGADGNPLSKPLKDIPATVNTAIIANKQSLSQLDRTIKLLEGKSVDGQTGDANATGYKGYLPQGILNRMDPSGIDARAGVADIGSLKLHDRSGAAVTASESPRLMPFIPTATDDNATALKKLKRLKQEVQSESNSMGEVYSKGQGYKANPLLQSQVGGGDIHAQADAILKGK